jgi:hypothetical protein
MPPPARVLNAEKVRADRKGKMKAKEEAAEEKEKKRVRPAVCLGHDLPSDEPHRTSSPCRTRACATSISAFAASPCSDHLDALPHRRVEQELRPALASAFKTSRQAEGRANKKKRKRTADDAEAAAEAPPAAKKPAKEVPADFAKAERRRLNDVAMEPPTLAKAARKATPGVSTTRLPLTLAQQAAIEDERTRAIQACVTLSASRSAH